MRKKMTLQGAPDYSREALYRAQGLGPVAGVDEAGRGPLAGPVVVAACILDPDAIPEGLNDSKKLTSARRAILFDRIRATSQSAIVIVSARVIDETNIRAATLKAMVEAVYALPVKPGAVIVDGRDWPEMPCAGEAVIKGDALSLSIAAASILAKVTRDRLMHQASTFWPGFGFEKHAGYGTAAHLEAIALRGPTPIHRMSFAPLKS